MALIKTSAEISSIIVVGGGFDPDNLLPFIPTAEIELVKILGDDLYSELLAYYEAGNNDVEELNALIIPVQRPLVYFGFVEGFDILNVSIGNNGITVAESTGMAPASKNRTDAAKQNMIDLAYKNVELLLRFLETNKANYPGWTESEAYSEQTEFLISNALMFDDYFRINKSRLTYLNNLAHMREAEKFDIAPKISDDLLLELKTQSLAGTLSAANLKIIGDVKSAIAFFTVFKNSGNKAQENTALNYIGLVQRYLNEHADDYPTFKNSSVYVEPKVFERYVNEGGNSFFVMGG